MKKYFLIGVALLFLAGCSVLQVQTDYNREFDFKSLSKFFVMYNKKDDGKDFTRGQVGRVLTAHFATKGYTLSTKNEASFYVLFHLDIQTKKQVETNYETMGLYPTRWYGNEIATPPTYMRDPYVSPLDSITTRVTTETYEYKEGHLVVEVIDAKSNNIVWQGIAKDELSGLSTAEEKNTYLNMVIEKLLKDFPKK